MLNAVRRWVYLREDVRKSRRLVSKDARRKIYPNRRSPYVPVFAAVYHR
jgi:hypothetical protein